MDSDSNSGYNFEYFKDFKAPSTNKEQKKNVSYELHVIG